jgi:multidrug efflux system membrane fusion protein
MNPPFRPPLSRGGRLAALLLAALAAVRPAPADPAAAAPAAVVVEATDAVTRTVPLTVDTVGHLDAVAAVAIVPLINGRIEAVLVADGAEVKAGQPLVRFDKRSYAGQLERMQAERAARATQVAALTTRAERSKNLIASGFLAQQQAQEQDVDLGQAQAALAAADAGIAQAAIDLENCEPKAPFDGRIGLLSPSAVAGNFVAAGSDPLFQVRAVDRLKVEFEVPESALPLLLRTAAGGTAPTVVVSQHSDPNRKLTGPVVAFDNAIDPHTHSLKVRGIVPNTDRQFWPGQLVDVQMIVGTATDATLVPYRAVNTGPNGPYLYVIQDGKAVVSAVELGQQVGDLVIVTSGVKPGDKVITGGQLGLESGSPVQVAAGSEASP